MLTRRLDARIRSGLDPRLLRAVGLALRVGACLARIQKIWPEIKKLA